MKVKFRRVNAIVLTVCMLVCLFVEVPQKTETANAMTTQSAAVLWARNQVGSQYNEGYGVQCVALISKYCDYLGVSHIYGHAKDFVSAAIPQGWSRLAGVSVQPGDIAIWTGGYYAEYGHVAIVLSSNGDSFDVIDQNGGGQQESGTIRTKQYAGGYWGVIRPNFNADAPISPSAPQDSPTPSASAPDNGDNDNLTGYVTLNQVFPEKSKVYFKLAEHGVVTFENSGKSCSTIVYRIADDGNETRCAKASRARLAPGKYRTDRYKVDKVNFTSEDDSPYIEREWNDSFDSANKIEKNITYTGNLNLDGNTSTGSDTYKTSDKDYYKFELEQAGAVQIQYSLDDLSVGGYYNSTKRNNNAIKLYNENEEGNVSEVCSVLVNKDKTRYSERYRLPKGIYYIEISTGDNIKYCNITDYRLKVNYEPETATDHEQEYNNTRETANEILTNTGYTGNIPTVEDTDYFKFTLSATSRVKLKMQIPRQSTDALFHAVLYKADDKNKITEVSTTTNPVAYSEKEPLLETGTYYVKVEAGKTTNSTADYTLTVEANKAIITEPEQTPCVTQFPNVPIATPTVLVPLETSLPAPTVVPTEEPNKNPGFSENFVKNIILTTDLEKNEKLRAGDNFTIYANIIPEQAEGTEILWSTSNSKIATVDKNGKVICVGAGKVVITAKATDGSGVSSSKTFQILKAKSGNNYLSKIAISQGKLTPAFKKTKTAYSLVLTKNMSKVIIKPITAGKTASMTINGKNIKKTTIKLKSGKSTIVKIKVRAENGKSRTYKIRVKRK